MDNDYFSILLRLKEERERRNLTQRLLCYQIKIQQSHFSKVETGLRRFTYSELKGLCNTDIDMLYVFTGKSPKAKLDFLDSEKLCLEEIVCLLDIIYSLARANQNNAAFEQIRQQLAYIRYGSNGGNATGNIFLYVRNRYGHTQQKMASMLGIDIKKLRELEKSRLMPDSEIVWKMYDLFRISPAFILKDTKGLLSELSYVLGLMEKDNREAVLQILKHVHQLCCPSVSATEPSIN